MKFKLTETRVREIIQEEIVLQESIKSTIDLVSPTNRSRSGQRWPEGTELIEKFSPKSSYNTDHLNAEFKGKINDLQAAVPSWPFKILTTYRSIPDQRKAMADGHSMVGNPYHSLHTSLTKKGKQNSYAVDLWPSAILNRSITSKDISQWKVLMNFYSDLGEAIKNNFSSDLLWGGDFKTPYSPRYELSWDSNRAMGWDPGHVQKKGISLTDMEQETRAGLTKLKDASDSTVSSAAAAAGDGTDAADGVSPDSIE